MVTVPAVAARFVVVAPAATVTEAGTVRAVLFDEIATEEPPVGAAIESVAVHVPAAPEPSDVGEHCKVVTVGRPGCATLTTPPVAETVEKDPSG